MLWLVCLTNLLKNAVWSCFVVSDTKGNWYVSVVGNWSSNGLIVSALANLVKLASRRWCSFCNYSLFKGFILYRTLVVILLSLVVLKRPGFQSQKCGMPIYTRIIKCYAVCFWIRDNQRYSKTNYISTRTKSMLCHRRIQGGLTGLKPPPKFFQICFLIDGFRHRNVHWGEFFG